VKIVFVTPYFSPKVGGLENYALEIARGLLDDGVHEVAVITSNHYGKFDTVDRVGNIEVHRLGAQFHASNTPVNLGWYSKIKKLLQNLKPDVVNAHTPVPYISDIAVRAAHDLNIPTVLTYQNDLVKDSLLLQGAIHAYYEVLGKRTLELADRIIATTLGYAQQSPYLSPHLEKISIIPPGVHPIQSVTRLPEHTVLFVGQLDATHRHKGLEYLIQAVHLLRDDFPSLRLNVIGRGNDVEYYKMVTESLGEQKMIDFLGYVEDSALQQLYANAICLVLPSITKSEGFGMVILEAALQKTPSINFPSAVCLL
jgi:glycosyltransferase involved in cell wall biosynthesis